MLKKKSALSYKFVWRWPLEPVSYRGRLLGVVVTHRCGRLHPDCPVMMSGWLQSFHTLQANSTSMPVAALGGNSVGWCGGDVPGAVCVATGTRLRAAASRFTPLQGGNLVGWCVDVGMCGTGASEGGCLVCGAASRFIPLQGGNLVCRCGYVCDWSQ